MSPRPYIPRAVVHRPGRSYLTPDEVAIELRVSRMTVYRRIHSGELPAIRIGRGLRIDEDALDAYIRGADLTSWMAEE